MSARDWAEVALLVVLLVVSTPLLGSYMAKVYGNKKAPGDRFFLPIERAIYRICRIDPQGEQRWTIYVLSMLVFTVVGFFLTYVVLRLQAHLPFNPNHLPGVPSGLSFNTAVSFSTNTNWQNYGGESTMSLFSQMFGLVFKQFISAAVGMVLAAAFIRGLARHHFATLGSFWVDLVRTLTRILVPIALVFAIFFISQGTIQNLHANQTVNTVAAQSVSGTAVVRTQSLPGGPVGSMIPIESLGDNGGGFFNANAAHPFEIPNGITDVAAIWLFCMIPFAFAWTYGKMVGSMRQAAVVLTAMVVLFSIGWGTALVFEGRGNPKFAPAGVTQVASATSPGGNLEGKDIRLGVALSATDANAATATSTGETNSAHDSYTPIGGFVPLFQIMLGEVDPGGTGTGLYGMLIMVIVTVFIGSLMVGRTPEYLGKKLEAREMKLVALYILILPFTVVLLTATSIVSTQGVSSLQASGPHGLTELAYAFTSMAHNNGSAFGGLSGNTPWYNDLGGLAMMVGRFALIIPALALAGSLARKRLIPATAGTLRSDTPLFTGMLMVITVVITGLTYFCILALGPLAEQFVGRF